MTLKWERIDDGGASYWLSARGRECEITLERAPYYCDRGNWIAKLHPTGMLLRDIDGQDGSLLLRPR
jgi:hypothetical protein